MYKKGDKIRFKEEKRPYCMKDLGKYAMYGLQVVDPTKMYILKVDLGAEEEYRSVKGKITYFLTINDRNNPLGAWYH